MTQDHYFDGIATKFAANIYGTSKGRLRHTLLLEALTPWLTDTPMTILEVGGGTGVMTRELLNLGHNLILTDASSEILELAQEALADTPARDDQLRIEQVSLWDLKPNPEVDMVICHAVLEWLAHPLDAIGHLYTLTPPGGRLSLSFFNRDAALFGNVLYGNFDYIARGMKVKNQVRLNPQNPLVPAEVIERAQSSGFELEKVTGIRCFHDYMKEKVTEDTQYQNLLAMERQYNQQAPYCWLGKYLHLMLRRPA